MSDNVCKIYHFRILLQRKKDTIAPHVQRLLEQHGHKNWQKGVRAAAHLLFTTAELGASTLKGCRKTASMGELCPGLDVTRLNILCGWLLNSVFNFILYCIFPLENRINVNVHSTISSLFCTDTFEKVMGGVPVKRRGKKNAAGVLVHREAPLLRKDARHVVASLCDDLRSEKQAVCNAVVEPTDTADKSTADDDDDDNNSNSNTVQSEIIPTTRRSIPREARNKQPDVSVGSNDVGDDPIAALVDLVDDDDDGDYEGEKSGDGSDDDDDDADGKSQPVRKSSKKGAPSKQPVAPKKPPPKASRRVEKKREPKKKINPRNSRRRLRK